MGGLTFIDDEEDFNFSEPKTTFKGELMPSRTPSMGGGFSSSDVATVLNCVTSITNSISTIIGSYNNYRIEVEHTTQVKEQCKAEVEKAKEETKRIYKTQDDETIRFLSNNKVSMENIKKDLVKIKADYNNKNLEIKNNQKNNEIIINSINSSLKEYDKIVSHLDGNLNENLLFHTNQIRNNIITLAGMLSR